MASNTSAERSTDRIEHVRLGVATASIAAGSIHAAVVPHHLAESTMLGAAFIATAMFQIAWGVTISVQLEQRILDIGAALNAAVVITWIASRTVGLPFEPHAWLAEPARVPDVTATALELLIIAGAALVGVSRADQG